jgi:tRNA (guanosine-2'-O-)-methyltransferase
MSPRFPYPDAFEFGGRVLTATEVIERLAPFASEERLAQISRVAGGRTYTVVPVLDGIIDPGNMNAVLRSAEGLGYGAAHVVEPRWDPKKVPGHLSRYDRRSLRRAGRGAVKWVHVDRWPDPATCVGMLRERGYRIVAAHFHPEAVDIASLDFTRPTALVLGNERDGVSPEMAAAADAHCLIPLGGFVESFNISVAAAVALYQARQDRLRRLGHHGDLAPDEQAVLAAHFLIKTVRAAPQILERAGD